MSTAEACMGPRLRGDDGGGQVASEPIFGAVPTGTLSGTDPDGTPWTMPYWLPKAAGVGSEGGPAAAAPSFTPIAECRLPNAGRISSEGSDAPF